jgi:hypothetical protein
MSGKRPFNFGTPPVGARDPMVQWIDRAFRQIEIASQEDLSTVFDEYSYTGTLTETREVDLTTPSVANLAAVLATLIVDIKKRGSRRKREET